MKRVRCSLTPVRGKAWRTAFVLASLFAWHSGIAAADETGSNAKLAESASGATPEKKEEAGKPGFFGRFFSGDSTPAEADSASKSASWPKERAPQPYEIVRSLQFLQDQIARGNAAAIRIQALLLRRYEPTFRNATPDVWKDGRNLRAAALFVLSGGPPSMLRAILPAIEANGIDAQRKALLLGSLAYVENRRQQALATLSALDLSFTESGLAAQIDLAVAQMQEEADPEDALLRLKEVMLRAPGTLLEEAALRMGVLVAERLGKHDTADLYARQYFERYSHSAYAGNFRARFAAAYADRKEGSADDVVKEIETASASLPEDQRLAILLSVSRRALVDGRLSLAAASAKRSLSFANAGKEDRQRALLYETAASVTDSPFAQSAAALRSIDRSQLHPADVQLLDATADVLKEIEGPLVADAASGRSTAVKASTTGNRATTAEASPVSLVSPTLARGRSLLDATSKDLQGP